MSRVLTQTTRCSRWGQTRWSKRRQRSAALLELLGCAPDKVVERLLPAQPADGRQHAKQVAAEEDGVSGVPRHTRHQRVGCNGEGSGEQGGAGAGVVGLERVRFGPRKRCKVPTMLLRTGASQQLCAAQSLATIP